MEEAAQVTCLKENRFLNLQTKLWREVQERKCNLKMALDFLPCTIF